MDQANKDRIEELKRALLKYLAADDRHYGELSRHEQHAQDLAQALNTSMDQLINGLANGGEAEEPVSPREQLRDRLMETAVRLQDGGKVDQGVADDFSKTLDMFDISADLERQAETVRDQAETAAIKHKRGR